MAEPVVDWSFFTLIDYLNRAEDDDRAPDPAAWSTLLDRLREAVEFVSSSPLITTPPERASAFRGLLQLVHFGLDRGIGSADPFRPSFSRSWDVHLFDFGAANPDGIYHTVALRDDVTYRISGNRGNADFLSFEFFAGTRQAGSIWLADLEADAEGNFEILFGPEKRDGNWLEVMPGTSSILTREFFGDWSAARPADLRIECLDPAPAAWPSLSGNRIEREIISLGDWLVGTVKKFMGEQAAGLEHHRNAFDPNVSRPDSGLPAVYHGFWDLAPDECLILEAAPPIGSYWGVQMANALWNTLDFANRQTSLNNGQLDREPDGSIRIVIAHRDPGVANWLDTLGHQRGALALRFTRTTNGPKERRSEPTLASSRSDWLEKWDEDSQAASGISPYPVPTLRVVRLADLDRELPHARRVTPDERRRVVDERLDQVRRLTRA